MPRDIPLGEQLLSPTLQRVGMPIVGYVLIMFFLLQGPVLFPEQWARWETVTLIYAGFLIPGLIYSIMNFHPFNIPAWKVLAFMGIGMVGGGALFWALFSQFRYEPGFPAGPALQTAVLHIFVIAYSEESFFRGFLLEVGQRGGTGVGIIVSAVTFSIFHLAAYSAIGGGLNFAAFGVAFLMGGIFGFVYLATRDMAGIGLVVGLHAAWNLVLLFG